jgi:hypothetical protein
VKVTIDGGDADRHLHVEVRYEPGGCGDAAAQAVAAYGSVWREMTGGLLPDFIAEDASDFVEALRARGIEAELIESDPRFEAGQ